jgi:hypothetical protein
MCRHHDSCVLCSFYRRLEYLLNLAAERAALGQAGLAAGGLAQNGGARSAKDNGSRVAEHGGDLEATGAFNVHEEAVRALYEALELVLGLLVGLGRVQQVVIGEGRHIAEEERDTRTGSGRGKLG